MLRIVIDPPWACQVKQRAEDAHGAERDDERLDLAERGGDAVEQPAKGADGERQRHRRNNQERRIRDQPGIQEQDFEARHEGRHRPDRQVEPAAGDDQRLSDRDRGDEGAARQDVGQIVEAEEARIGKRAQNADQPERQERRDRDEVDPAPRRCGRRLMNRLSHPRASPTFASTPVARTTILCSVIASPVTSPAIRPLRMTMIR